MYRYYTITAVNAYTVFPDSVDDFTVSGTSNFKTSVNTTKPASQDYANDENNTDLKLSLDIQNQSQQSIQNTKAIEQNTRRNQIKKGSHQEKTFLNSTLNFTKALVNQIIDERDSEEDVVSLITGKNN